MHEKLAKQNSQENLPEAIEPNQKVVPTEVDPVLLDPLVLDAVTKAAIRTSISISQESHSGPMPSPKILSEYEQVVPGLAAQIRDEFLANGAHIRKLEEKSVDAHIQNDNKNRQVARELVWGALGGSIFLAYFGHDWVAGLLAATTVGAVIAGFLRTKKNDKHHVDIENKNQQD